MSPTRIVNSLNDGHMTKFVSAALYRIKPYNILNLRWDGSIVWIRCQPKICRMWIEFRRVTILTVPPRCVRLFDDAIEASDELDTLVLFTVLPGAYLSR